VRIAALDPPALLARLEALVAAGGRGYACFANVHGVMEAQEDASLRRVYNATELTVPDGMPLVWLGRWRGHPGVRRCYGPQVTLELARAAARSGWPCFFYGGGPGVAEALAAVLARRFPGLVVSGTGAPPFRPLTEAEDEATVASLNDSGARIVFVGLGCPKQEKWMAEHRARLHAPLLLGVGAAFDFHTGRVPQAPGWMQGAGLEWLSRLAHEPRRLWRRYLVLNPLFAWNVALELLGLRRFGRS
jgi:N-acetylglucosaminyldiphosphoundecaprenol N-acetyl-beta-D-mannosaminyltransferase